MNSPSSQAGTSTQTQPATVSARHAVIAASAGNVVEFYDNIAFGLLAATLGKVFFPSTDPGVSLLAAFSAFAVTFLARPFGGLVFGSLGDRLGRQRTLIFVILLMTVATVGIGLLPGYDVIGIAAPILLILLRIVQGLSFGGELGGVLAFIVEHAKSNNRGTLVGLVMAAAFVGNLLALAVITGLSAFLSSAEMLAWGWRIPFLLAGPLGLIGLYIRRRLDETPAFRAIQEAGEIEQFPLRAVVRGHYKALLKCAGLAIVALLPIYLMEAYNTNYLLVTVRISQSDALTATLVATVVAMAFTVLSGRLSDRYGRKPVLLASLIVAILLAYPAYVVMIAGSALSAVAGQTLMGIIRGGVTGITAVAMIELFPTRLRYSGFALAYGLTAAIFGGTVPLVATYLVEVTENPFAPAFYLMVIAAISLATALTLRETAPFKSQTTRINT
ncbi:MFS transporter [Paenarthrobacter sp. TYUT067]|uniref:MFS transporter n=1 Tax=Paenarthrobacter sp. TYUT067 TaxID=2926245 RepID=UPI00202FB507|nr:MFS transporter [Paenarthrobacter sp. TYUT067]MCM0614992.1 MFS transporter [Paenarthrobacter sp. TYUT067]